MSEQTNDVKPAVQEAKPSDKELNFRQLEAKYQKQLEQERQARLEAEKKAQDLSKRHMDDDDDDDEPYVDKRKLKKEQARFGEQIKHETQNEIRSAVSHALQEERRSNWIKSNPDFYDVLQKHAETLAVKAPDLAETILEMPDTFERQKLVYKNIKTLGLDRPEEKKPSIQDKVDSNRRAPYYQPTGVGSAPYSSQADFSPAGQKQAYTKMQELKNRLRLG